MTDATFIVRGVFTGDGSGNAVACTGGSRGWGAIKAEPNGNIGPSGQPIGADQIGLPFDFALRDGYLESKDCPTDVPTYQCGANAIVKLWEWQTNEFARV